MFAVNPRTQVIIRVILIAVILFNAVAPNAVAAFSLPVLGKEQYSNAEELDGGRLPNSLEDAYQTFPRPISPVSEKSNQPVSVPPESSDVRVKCTTSGSSSFPSGATTCTDPTPAISLEESFQTNAGINWYTGGQIRFKLECTGSNCAPPDIYYLAILDGQFATTSTFGSCGQDCFWGADLHANINFLTTATWGDADLVCGTTPSGTCHFELSGVIPAEMISSNTSTWSNNNSYFDILAYINNAASWEYLAANVTISASLDPNLLNSQVPAESINCKGGCYYSQSQGVVADPINTNTGTLSYVVNDLEMPTSAGALTFKRSYVSSYVDTFTSPLGYGWVHNQDKRLIFPALPVINEPAFVRFKDQSGNLYRFWYMKDSPGNEYFVPYSGYTASLTKNSGTPTTYTLQDQAQNVYLFDQNGKLSTHTNPTGQAFTYTYDSNGRLSRVSADGATRYLDFAYNAQGLLLSVTDHANRSVSFHYDANGDLDTHTDVLGRTWSYLYNAHRLIQVNDPSGNMTMQTQYDAQGRAISQHDGEGNLIAALTYNANGTTAITDALNNQSVHTYDSRGTLVTDTNPLIADTDKTYDSNFRPATITDADGNTTNLTWSADGANLTSILDADNNQTDITYNSLNLPTSVIDPRGFLTTFAYSGTLLTSTTNALNQTTTYTYTPQGYRASVTDPLNHTTSYAYDSQGQQISMTDPLNNRLYRK